MTTVEKKETVNRNSRDSETHDNQARRKPWRPVRKLETPPAPPGYTYRWIRAEMLGEEDRSNVSRRLREGFDLVMGSELTSDWQHMPTTDNGRHAGVVTNEGLLLAKIPTESVDERNAYYSGKNEQAKEALDNTVFSDAQRDGRYVKYDPQRDSKVTFGKS
jgi:hypothetical protein|tara:strand:+ start:6960 stop:7442 length:483 start_codon:yes stop_codon:yes gene_type:complete